MLLYAILPLDVRGNDRPQLRASIVCVSMPPRLQPGSKLAFGWAEYTLSLRGRGDDRPQLRASPVRVSMLPGLQPGSIVSWVGG